MTNWAEIGHVDEERLRRVARVLRVFDIAIAGTSVVILSPLFLLLGASVAIASGLPILFRQTRAGYRESPFVLLKFRTMAEVNADVATADVATADDESRTTAVGRLLRQSSLDELPQLINVLRGDMSMVGPRPLLPRYHPYYLQEERRRFLVKPGITGLAQVSGRTRLSWSDRLRLDAEFVDHYSVGCYLHTLLRTPGALIWREANDGARSRPLDVERARDPMPADSTEPTTFQRPS